MMETFALRWSKRYLSAATVDLQSRGKNKRPSRPLLHSLADRDGADVAAGREAIPIALRVAGGLGLVMVEVRAERRVVVVILRCV